MTPKQKERDEAIDQLRKYIASGSTVYTILRHVARSGMSRRISMIILDKGRPVNIDGYAARALGLRRDHKKGGLTVGGCGMDMGFHIVFNLSATLFDGNGYAIRHEWL